jgi:hypothetical protein
VFAGLWAPSMALSLDVSELEGLSEEGFTIHRSAARGSARMPGQASQGPGRARLRF